MARTRTTVTLDTDVLRAVKIRAARTGKSGSEVIEESLRLHLGLNLVEQLWDRNAMDEVEAMAVAVEAQHETRPR